MKFVLFGRLKKGSPQTDAGGAAAARPPQQAHTAQKQSVEERISFLVSQGLAEPEIIKILKDEGYSFQEIDSGISNILKSRVSDMPMPEPGRDTAATEELTPLIMPAEEETNQQRMQAQMTEQMDAVMEQMMEEKFSSLSADLDNIDTRFDALEDKIQKLANRINEVEAGEKKQDEAADEKIEDVNLKEADLEPRITGLEKAFKDIIPGLVESIRELREVIISKKRERDSLALEDDLEKDTAAHKEPEEPAKPTAGNSSIFD